MRERLPIRRRWRESLAHGVCRRSESFAVLLAESIPRLGLFISLMGSVSSTMLALIFPPLLDWAWRWRAGLPVWRHLANSATIAVGILGCGWGSYAALNDIIVAFGNVTVA